MSAGHAVWRLKNARRLGRDRGVHTHASRGGGGAEHLFLRWDSHWKHGLARESRLKSLGNSDTPPIAMRARVRALIGFANFFFGELGAARKRKK